MVEIVKQKQISYAALILRVKARVTQTFSMKLKEAIITIQNSISSLIHVFIKY